MSAATRNREDVNTEFTARTYSECIGPADFAVLNRLIADGKTDEEIEDQTGIFEETIAEYRSGSWGDTSRAGDQAMNEQIRTDLPKHLADKVFPSPAAKGGTDTPPPPEE